MVRNLLFALALVLQAVPLFAERSGVRVSPLPADRQALENLFDAGGAHRTRILFSPEISGRRPEVQAEGQPQATAVSFNGLQIPSFVFSREQRVSQTLVAIIDKTQKTMDLSLYVISLPDVADAIVRAKVERRVAVRVIMDHSHVFPGAGKPRAKELDALIKAGVEIRSLRGASTYGIMHNKFGVYDGKLLSAGSFNWTTAADLRHFENALFRDQAELLAAFQGYWDWMWARATPLSGLSVPPENTGPPQDGARSLSFKGKPWPSYAFSPLGGTQKLLIDAIDLCKVKLDIAMFSFYSEDIAKAVVRAKDRGIAVRLVMDRGQGRSTPLKKFFTDNDIDFKFSAGVGGVGVLHHKFALFDGELLETGSYNFSNNAEVNNYENSIFSASAGDLKGFANEFEFLYGQASAPDSVELAVAAGPVPADLP